jgi:uncharacterized MnhB-related membrane protein
MITLIITVLGAVILAGAVLALVTDNLTSAIIANAVVSLFTSIIFLVLASPDVAMTEAAVGSALTTVVFILALNKINRQSREAEK